MEKKNILKEAEEIVNGQRRKDYGTPTDNHSRTAAMWNAYLSKRYPGIALTATDVCWMSILTKVSRAACSPGHYDSRLDVIGYALNLDMIQADLAVNIEPDPKPAKKNCFEVACVFYGKLSEEFIGGIEAEADLPSSSVTFDEGDTYVKFHTYTSNIAELTVENIKSVFASKGLREALFYPLSPDKPVVEGPAVPASVGRFKIVCVFMTKFEGERKDRLVNEIEQAADRTVATVYFDENHTHVVIYVNEITDADLIIENIKSVFAPPGLLQSVTLE